MTAPKGSLAMRVLKWLAAAVYRYPRVFFYPQVVLTILCIYYTKENLVANASRNDLVGRDKRYHHNFLEYRKEFPGQDDLVVVVESPDISKNRQFVERLGAKLESETNIFTDVFFKGDLKMMGSKALLMVDAKSLGELRQTLKDYQPFISKFASATNLDSLFQLINRQFRTASREANAENESLIKVLPALTRIVVEAEANLHRAGEPPSPGITALFGGAEQEMYITYGDGKLYLVTAHARTEDLNAKAVERLRQLVYNTQVEVPGINVGVTGEPVLEVDEMKQSQDDTILATMISLGLVALIFIYGYQQTGRPIKATICLVVGLVYSLGYTTLTVGHLNILTITFMPMLIGLAIDFGVHLISRYEEELRHGLSMRKAMEKAMVFTGLGIFTGCFTTASAFLAMSITKFRGIQEMGLISGGGLLICVIPMMTLLPVLLLRGRQNAIDHELALKADRRARFERLWLERPVWTLGVAAGICLLCVPQMRRVIFDYNLLNMQSAGLPAVITEKKLIHSASNSVLFGAVIAKDIEHAQTLERQLTNLSTVANVRSIANIIPPQQDQQLLHVREIKRLMSKVAFAPFDLESVDVKSLDQTLWSLKGYLGAAIDDIRRNEPNEVELMASLQQLQDAIMKWRRTMQTVASPLTSSRLSAFQQALFKDIRDTFEALKNQDDNSPLRPEDLPAALRNRFVGQTGKLLLQVYPKDDVWQRANQEAFVRQLRSVDPDTTGTPIQLYEYTTLLKNSYQEAAWYALGAIVLLILLHFRRILCVILALMPVAIGTIWMVGFMGWRGIPFNPANIMTLPLVIGIGVTNGIHILNRFAEESNPGILAKSTGKAIIVSALTTVAGFGSLILAKHQGIASLGWVMAVGTSTCMIAGLTVLPAVIKLLMRMGWTIELVHKSSGKSKST